MARVAMPVQTGEVIDYKNDGEAQINVGDVVPFTQLCGVAEIDIPPGETGTVTITKVWEVPAISTGVFAVGDLLYWDSSAKKATASATGNTLLGVCVAPKASGTTVTRVKIGVLATTAASS